jgi:ribosomal protein S17E
MMERVSILTEYSSNEGETNTKQMDNPIAGYLTEGIRRKNSVLKAQSPGFKHQSHTHKKGNI